MTLLNHPSFWQQLNGPIVTAIFEGIRQWWYKLFHPNMEYFWNFDIDHMTGPHLTTTGLLMGIPRPLVYDLETADDTWFTFQQYFEPIGTSGFDGTDTVYQMDPVDTYDDLPDPATVADRTKNWICRVLNDPDPEKNKVYLLTTSSYQWEVYTQFEPGLLDTMSRGPDTIPYVYVDDPTFRKLLKAIITSKGERGSLVMLDDICYAILGSKYTLLRRDNIYPGDMRISINTNSWEYYVLFLTLVKMWVPWSNVTPTLTGEPE